MVTFYLINPTRDTSSIGILVSFKGAKYRRSIGESIPVKYWNKTKKRVKTSAEFSYGSIINDTIDKWNYAALRALAVFKEYSNPPASEEFFAQLDKEFYKDDKQEPEMVYFTDYLYTYIKRYESARSIITIRHYNTTRNKLIEYEKTLPKRLSFEDINIEFYTLVSGEKFSDNVLIIKHQ